METKEIHRELLNKGIEAFINNNTYEAVLAFKEILKDNPEDDKANYYLANSYALMEGAAEFSIPYFKKALELNEDKYEYYLDLSATLKYIGKHEEALRILEKACEKFENIGNAYIMMSSIYLAKGREIKARNLARLGNSYPRYIFDNSKKEWIAPDLTK